MRILLITAALLPLAACHANWGQHGDGHQVKPSGVGASRTYNATGFTGVDLRGSDNVDVKVGGAFSVKAEGDSALLEELEITVADGTLKIGRKGHDGWNWNSNNDQSLRIHVTMPALSSASVAGSGDLVVDKASGNFKGAIGGSGNLTVASLTGGDVDLAIGGSGDLKVSGTATRLSANVAGSGDIDAKGLTASSASVSVVGSGNINATVNGNAAINIAGSGDVDLGGGAKCAISAVGSGEAHCG